MGEISAHVHQRSILLLEVSGKKFGIAVEAVREIVPMATLSRPPGLPSIVEGLLNLRGVAFAVLRLDLLLGIAQQSVDPYSPLVILRHPENPAALLAQRVIGIASLPSDGFLPIQQQAFNGCIESDVLLDTDIVHVVAPARLLLERERKTIMEFQRLEAARLRDLAGLQV